MLRNTFIFEMLLGNKRFSLESDELNFSNFHKIGTYLQSENNTNDGISPHDVTKVRLPIRNPCQYNCTKFVRTVYFK